MSDTPRTDEKVFPILWYQSKEEIVPAKFARELELEVKQWKECADAYAKFANMHPAVYLKAEIELALEEANNLYLALHNKNV